MEKGSRCQIGETDSTDLRYRLFELCIVAMSRMSGQPSGRAVRLGGKDLYFFS